MVTWSAPQECCTTNDTKKCIHMCNKKLSSSQLTMHLLDVYNNMTCQQYGVWWATDTKWGPTSLANLLDAQASHRTRDCCGPGCEHRKMMYNIIQHYTTLYLKVYKYYVILYYIMLYYIILYHIILYYIYYMWTEWSLFRMCCLQFARSFALQFPAFQDSIAESCGLFFAELGSWAKHCVWRSIPWNTTGSLDAVFPYSPHLHPPCSVLSEFTEHEGWELINFTLMYICLN